MYNYFILEKYMEPESIGLTPMEYYSPQKRFSSEACYYIHKKNQDLISQNQPIYHHAGNFGEKKIGQYYLDGYIPELKKGIEYLGKLLLVFV